MPDTPDLLNHDPPETMTFAARAAFILRNRTTLHSIDLLTDATLDVIDAAEYSTDHARRLRHTVTYSHDTDDLLRIFWNACTWAGLNPQRQLDEWAAADLADEMADEDVDDVDPADDASYEDDGDSFELLLIEAGDWNAARAGDCGSPEDFATTLHELDLPNYWL